MNLPPSWEKMTFYSKLCYLMETHQARDMKEAHHMLGGDHKKKPAPPPAAPSQLPLPMDERPNLPYKD